MVNAWPVDETAARFAETFRSPGHAVARRVPVDQPHREIALSLDSRATQVIARVSVVDGLGRPVPGAAVTGTWSGVISTGDTARATDGTGNATLYSSRTRSTGTVKFCVANVSAAGKDFVSDGNIETCDAITK